MKEIKHQFFIYRNGALAETLHRCGMPYKLIFGLNLPQISDIAAQTKTRLNNGDCGELSAHEMANKLWSDRDVRESRLLACYLFDSNIMQMEDAIKMATDVRTQEEADILSFRLLRYLSYAQELLDRLRVCGDESGDRVADSLKKFI